MLLVNVWICLMNVRYVRWSRLFFFWYPVLSTEGLHLNSCFQLRVHTPTRFRISILSFSPSALSLFYAKRREKKKASNYLRVIKFQLFELALTIPSNFRETADGLFSSKTYFWLALCFVWLQNQNTFVWESPSVWKGSTDSLSGHSYCSQPSPQSTDSKLLPLPEESRVADQGFLARSVAPVPDHERTRLSHLSQAATTTSSPLQRVPDTANGHAALAPWPGVAAPATASVGRSPPIPVRHKTEPQPPASTYRCVIISLAVVHAFRCVSCLWDSH